MPNHKKTSALAHARAVKAARRHLATQPVVIELSRRAARYLLERLDGADPEALSVRRQILDQAFPA